MGGQNMELDFNPVSILVSLIFSIVGFYYIKFGKTQGNMIMIFTGFGLFAYPLFVSGPIKNILVGSCLASVPWLAQRMGFEF